MTRRRIDLITDAISFHGVKGRLRVEDVILSYVRSEYVTGDGLDKVLEEIDNALAAREVGDVPRRSVLNIVFELALNSVMHSGDCASSSELLAIGLRDGHVSVSLFGKGRSVQINRLSQVIASVKSIADPPEHQAEMLKRRDEDAWRRRNEPESESRGGGLGMLTIAALSSQALFFVQKVKDQKASFVLQSIV